MDNLETGYQPLFSYNENGEETPQETNVMIHVVPESSKARWNHIEDLDSFFTRVYQYHQKHGFTCMMLQQVLELVQYLFVVLFTIFLFECVDYPVLFHDKIINNSSNKITLNDAFIPLHQCASRISATMIMCITVAFIFWLLRLIKVIYHFFQFLEIKSFYSTALKINETDLDSMTWHEVQARMQEVQMEQQMCIHKQDLTELDIYHRILRFKNYMVAMVNKSLLPLKFTVPFLGDYVFLSKGLKYNLELILFWGPWAPFENNWHLKEDYKKVNKRKELAEFLSQRILWIGIANFILCPLILLWQILYSFFNYAEIIKREPGILGARRWSLYGRLYLRHFNELDHELNARLNRGYRPASKFMSIFTSHFLAIIAKNIVFFAGSVLAVLIILTVYDEDVIQVEHVLTLITVLGIVIAGSRVFIPDEHLVWCPEKLMMSVLAHIHYIPDDWRGNAHTTRVRDEFTHLFQYKAAYLIEELLSPIITPIILCVSLRYKALDIVDFYRNFTVEVVGVGDVCSFAQMDVRKHGNPQWMTEGQTQASQYQQAEDGKTELSLMHFKLTNPNWIPPEESTVFLTNLRQQANRDANNLHYMQEENPLYLSLHSTSSLGAGYFSVVNNILRNNLERSGAITTMNPTGTMNKRFNIRGAMSQIEGPPCNSHSGLLSSLNQGSDSAQNSFPTMASLHCSGDSEQRFCCEEQIPLEFTAAEMSFSALYMHEHLEEYKFRTRKKIMICVYLHYRHLRPHSDHSHYLWQRGTQEMPNIQEMPQEEERAETTPLLTRST